MRFQFNSRKVIFKLTLVSGGWGISYDIALRWMPLDLTDDKSTLVQVMAWCRQATSHYLSQCWPRSLSPYGATRPQWVMWYFQAEKRVSSLQTGFSNVFLSIKMLDFLTKVHWRSIDDQTISVKAMVLCCQSINHHMNWPNSQIPEYTCSIPQNAPFRTEMRTFLFWMEHSGIWNRCILGFMKLVYWFRQAQTQPSGIILGLGSANEKRRFYITPSLIGWDIPTVIPEWWPSSSPVYKHQHYKLSHTL